MNVVRKSWVMLLVLALPIGGGCRRQISPTGGDADFQTRRSMSALASMYGDYMSAYGAPPKDEATFRKFLEERGKLIERMQLGGVDGILKSPRDEQPLVVVYGKRINPPNSPNTPWAAYEQVGVDGKRMAIQVRGALEELTDEQIKQTFAAQAKK